MGPTDRLSFQRQARMALAQLRGSLGPEGCVTDVLDTTTLSRKTPARMMACSEHHPIWWECNNHPNRGKAKQPSQPNLANPTHNPNPQATTRNPPIHQIFHHQV